MRVHTVPMVAITALLLAACSGGSGGATSGEPSPTSGAALTRATAAASSPPPVTPTPLSATPFPTTTEDSVMEATVRECMQGLPDGLPDASNALDTCLNRGEGGFIVAEVTGDVPAVLVERPGEPGLCRSDDFVVWRSDAAWSLQFVTPLLPDPIDDRLLGTAVFPTKLAPAGLVREATDGGTALLSVLALTNSCGSGPRSQPVLFALSGQAWQLAWDPRGSALTTLSDSRSDFADAAGINSIHVRGELWGGDAAGSIFYEAHPGPHRIVDQTWQRDGQRYRLAGSETEPSAYNTLVTFVYLLSSGDDSGAAKLLADQALIRTAKQLGLVQGPIGQAWVMNLDPSTQCCGPIHILSGPQWRTGPPQPVVVTFVHRGNDWLISSIDADHTTTP